MQTQVSTPTRTNTKGEANQNPVRVFEEYAKRIWQSPQSVEDKSMRLVELGNTIGDYVKKIDSLLTSKKLDMWEELSINRSKAYLEHLASDVRMLASTAPNAS